LFGLVLVGVDPSVVQSGNQIARTLGHRLDVLNVYVAFSSAQPLPTDLLHAADAAGVIPEITWEPWDPDHGVKQPLYSLAQIAGVGMTPTSRSGPAPPPRIRGGC
jgi:mannan endo-1,4-beta-mannosidase